jgi:hypothetical protein
LPCGVVEIVVLLYGENLVSVLFFLIVSIIAKLFSSHSIERHYTEGDACYVLLDVQVPTAFAHHNVLNVSLPFLIISANSSTNK